VVGGLASIAGAIFGGIFIVFVPNLADHISKAAPGAVYGAVLIACMYLMPFGVAGLIREFGLFLWLLLLSLILSAISNIVFAILGLAPSIGAIISVTIGVAIGLWTFGVSSLGVRRSSKFPMHVKILLSLTICLNAFGMIAASSQNDVFIRGLISIALSAIALMYIGFSKRVRATYTRTEASPNLIGR
jgi:hypothetical protein